MLIMLCYVTVNSLVNFLFVFFGGVGSKNAMVPERVVHALNRRVEEGMIRSYMQQKNRFYGTSNFENG